MGTNEARQAEKSVMVERCEAGGAMCDAVIVPTVRVAHGRLPQVRVAVEGWLVFVQEPQVVQAPRLGRRVTRIYGPWNRLLDLRLVQPLD